jgi:hypothetical protein
MQYIILSSVACLAVPYFSTLSHKRQTFWINITKHEIHVLIFSATFVSNTSQSKKNRQDIIINVLKSSGEGPTILVSFNEILTFLTDFQKYSNSKLHENLSGGSQVVPCGCTDDKANSQFFNCKHA